jgi:hypothetical protein
MNDFNYMGVFAYWRSAFELLSSHPDSVLVINIDRCKLNAVNEITG